MFNKFSKELVCCFPVKTEEGHLELFEVTHALDVLVAKIVVYAAESSQ